MQQKTNNWQTKKLGEVVDVFDKLRKPINSTERLKRINGKKTKDLFPYYGATGQVGWIDSYLTEGEFILVGEDGAPFLDNYKSKAYKIFGKTWVNNHAHILKEKENITLNSFILYYLNSIDYKQYVNGTTRLKLTKGSLLEIPFPLPPLETQHAIVSKIEELFSELDKGIAELKTAQQQLKTYRQSVLKSAFEGKLTVNQFKKLKYITLKIGSGSTPKGGTENYKNSGIPLVRSLNIHFDYIKYEGLAYIDDLQAEKLKNVIVKENDVLLNITGASIGRVNIAPKEFHNGRVNQHVSIIRPQKDIFLSKYLKYFIQTTKIQNWISNSNYGVTRQALTKSMLENLELPLPSTLEEQHQIVQEIESRLSVADKMEQSIQESLQKAEALRQSILKKAFCGELV